MATSKKNQIHVTPVGTAAWPWLNKPDVRFDADGVYQVKMIFNKKDIKPIQAIVDPLMDGGKHHPIKPEMDDEGNPTGNHIVQFKMKARVKTKNGEEFTQKPILLDTLGNRVVDQVGAGSKLKIAYQAIPFNQGAGGVTMRMQKVRIVELVEYQDKIDWGKDSGSFVGTTETAPKEEEEAVVAHYPQTNVDEDF